MNKQIFNQSRTCDLHDLHSLSIHVLTDKLELVLLQIIHQIRIDLTTQHQISATPTGNYLISMSVPLLHAFRFVIEFPYSKKNAHIRVYIFTHQRFKILSILKAEY